MCGICGVVFTDSDKVVAPGRLERMSAALRHRGPDSGGDFQEPGVALGVRRLAIVDPEGGDQPVRNEDGSVVVVANGEIYNHVELRAELGARGHRFRGGSDIEVIAHLYEELGDRCVERLRGMFAFALWDGQRRRLLLARDRFGIKPLLISDKGDRLAFASEVKALLAGDLVSAEIDLLGLSWLFELGFVPGPRTMFAGVASLPPAHTLTWENGWATVTRYWQPPFPTSRSRGGARPEELAEELLELLTESVRLHLRSDVPVCALLSAGVDSSTVAALAAGRAASPLETFTLEFDDPELDETRHQSILTDFTSHQLPNTRVRCTDEDLGRLPEVLWFTEAATTTGLEIARFRLAEATAERYRVALTGEGSDEILSGYGWYQVDKALRPLARIPLAVRRLLRFLPPLTRKFPRASRLLMAPSPTGLSRFARMAGPPEWDVIGDELWSEPVRASIRDADRAPDGPALPSEFAHWHPQHRLQFVEMQSRLPDYINLTLDRACMAHSLEARLPFLDHVLAERCARMPVRWLQRRLQEKYLLRRAVAGVVPAEIAWRRKRGLAAPVSGWLRGPLPEFAEELLSPASLRGASLFRPKTVRRLLREHREEGFERGRVLFGVLSVQLWWHQFCRGGGTERIGPLSA